MKYLLYLVGAIVIAFLASCSCEKCAECSNSKLGTKEKFCNKEGQAVVDWQYDRKRTSPYIDCKNVDQ